MNTTLLAPSPKTARVLATFALAAAALLAEVSPAWAQLAFTFTAPAQAGTVGTTLSFFGSLNNTSGGAISFNGFSPGLTATGLTVTDLFFTNVPDPLASGLSGPFHVFDVKIGTSAVPGLYTGLVNIDYDTTTATSRHTTQTYSVRVQPPAVPEQSTWLGLGLGLVVLGILVCRSRRGAASHLGE